MKINDENERLPHLGRRGRRSRGGTGFGNAGPIREIRTRSAAKQHSIYPHDTADVDPLFQKLLGRLVLCRIKIDFSD